MKHIAIIPARAGSKSIKNKNLVKLDGKETITERAVRLAKESGLFSKIILSTDIPTLIHEYDKDKRVTVYERKAILATDEALMLDVVQDINKHFGYESEWIWLLQPTSPFRTRAQLIALKHMVETCQYRSFISVADVGAMHPNRVYQKKNKKLFPIIKTSFNNKQALPELFIRNGCYYIFRAKDLERQKSFYIHPCYGVVMEDKESINIDTPMDLEWAKIIFKEMKYGRIH
jgi:CMP-N-acetylneuraminic acid synthetase